MKTKQLELVPIQSAQLLRLRLQRQKLITAKQKKLITHINRMFFEIIRRKALRGLKKICIFAKKKSTIMEHKYSQEESETPQVSELAVSRVCSIKDAQRRSLTIDQLIDKLHTMVDDFYSAKE